MASRVERAEAVPRAARAGGMLALPGGAGVIAATKLHIPVPRAGLVPHRALLEALANAPGTRLALVGAPAGAGKTTLLAGWHASPSERRPFAWLSLDEADDDPVRFWSCVVEALRTVGPPRLGEAALGALPAPVPLEELALPLLINELALLPEPVVLVLDDYHLIRTAPIHRSLAFLLDRLPPTLQIAIASRTEPALPIARLRARGQLLEVRGDDLRCTGEQADALLNGVFGLSLQAGDVDRLLERTEGWAAGLQLAALSLSRLEDRRAFIDAFAGDDRQIVDYLGAELLETQPPETREFLLRTSILERLSGPLCDAVTGSAGSRERLSELERANLFVIALDTRREWFRYHHLFAELLRAELHRARPDEPPRLHARAADWYLQAGAAADAVHHGLLAGDPARAAELVAEHWTPLFNQGRLATVSGWLERLGAPATAADPRLAMARAWLAMDSGRLDLVERWIAVAEQRAGAPGDVAVLRAVHAFKVGDLPRAAEAGRRVLSLGLDAGAFPRTVATCILGIARYWEGSPAEAAESLGVAVALAADTGNDLALAYARGYLALIAAGHSPPEEAERAALEAIRGSDEPGFAEHFVLSIAHLARAAALARLGRLEEATAAAERAVGLSRRGAGRVERAAALLAVAELARDRGDRDAARAAVARAREQLDGAPAPGIVETQVRRAERLLGDTPAGPGEPLSDRELEVLRLLDGELSLRDVARSLFVSHNTVKTHVRSIYRKLGVATRAEAVARGRHDELL